MFMTVAAAPVPEAVTPETVVVLVVDVEETVEPEATPSVLADMSPIPISTD